jgi:hypothetical protein
VGPKGLRAVTKLNACIQATDLSELRSRAATLEAKAIVALYVDDKDKRCNIFAKESHPNDYHDGEDAPVDDILGESGL